LREKRLNTDSLFDDESVVRILLRLLCFSLALLFTAAGGLGLWLERSGDAGARALEKQTLARARSWMDAKEVPSEDRRPYLDQVRALNEGLVGLARPPAYGGTFGVGGVLLLFALFGLRASDVAPARTRDTAKGGKSKKGDKAAPKESALQFQEESPKPSSKERKKALKLASQLEKQDGPEAAADFLLQEGLRDEAFEIFMRAELLVRAGEVRHDQNRFDEAAELYVKAEAFDAAGKIYSLIDRYAEAARCYVAADKKSVAAEMFERGECFKEAGDCYLDIGFVRQAAQCYLRGRGCGRQAAETLVRIYDDEGGVTAARADSQVKDMRAIAKKAGDLLFSLDRFEEAESILSRAELWEDAARVAFQRGNHAAAAEWFLKVSRGDLAARALMELGDEQGAARALGMHLRDKGDLEQAAGYLARAGEWEEAAGLYRSLERLGEAGKCYLKSGDYAAAAEMFRAVNDPASAAQAYEKNHALLDAAACYGESGDDARQAELLERAHQPYAAGRVHFEAGRLEEAIRVLQMVPEEDADFLDASSVLGKIFEQRGMDSLAFRKLDQATADQAVSAASVDAYYSLAGVCEKRGDTARAVEILERILAFDYQYSDCSQRLEQLKEQERRNAPTTEARALPAALRGDGDKSARYQVQREIGRGGMGVVYLARDTVLERDVAFKVLPEQLRENPDALRNFLREAKAAAKLNHPHIVTVYDVGESAHGYYLAMELVEGTTLKEIVQKRGPIAPSGLVYILRQMAEALAYAHSKKVVHRDIKTANTMWTPDKQVKVMDFGLAKLLEEVRNATTTISGTPFYMSPEQTLGKNVDHRTDLYSLGVTLFELATGQLPFRRGNVPYHHVHTAPPDPRSCNPRLPQAISAVILRCLQKAPSDRYSSAKELVEDLARRMKGEAG